MTVLDDFQGWKQFLHQRVSQAKGLGLGQEEVCDLAYHLGHYLAKDVNPQNVQEHLLQDLWTVANEEEQRTMAQLMVKLVDDGRE